jgi:hypothetical protein
VAKAGEACFQMLRLPLKHDRHRIAFAPTMPLPMLTFFHLGAGQRFPCRLKRPKRNSFAFFLPSID